MLGVLPNIGHQAVLSAEIITEQWDAEAENLLKW